MKCFSLLALLPVVWATLESPGKKVILFIEELKAEILADMEKEKKTFDTFKTWCSETMDAAKANLKSGEETLESCNRRIEELSGFEAAGEAEISNADKNLGKNLKRQQEATAIREKELKSFEASKAELDSSLKAMNDALAEFNSSEVSKDVAFLQRKNLWPGVLPLRKLLDLNVVNSKMAVQDLQLLSRFTKMSSGQTQLLQGDINGEYNSASGQVIGVIKTTKEDFEEDLKELTSEETEKRKVHGEMLSALQEEQKELESFLLEQKSNDGNSKKELSEKKTLRDETSAQLKADQALLTDTEDTCKEKTYQFDERKKLRDQELKGVDSALQLLSSDDAKATFDKAASFVQVKTTKSNHADEQRQQAYRALQLSATQSHSLSLAKLAVQLKTGGGAFRKVLQQIDKQIDFLKAEEKEDVEHKERCLTQMAQTDASIATLDESIAKADAKIQRMVGRQGELEDALKTLKADTEETKKDIKARQASRDEERKEHLEALKHDQDALSLLETATEQITEFFKKNKIDGAGFIQRHNVVLADPKYEKMPDAGFKDADYGGQKETTKGLVALMQMIKEDVLAEIENGKKQDEENQALFEKDYTALQDLLDKQKEEELTTTKALADLKADTESSKELKDDKAAEKTAEEKNKENLHVDCAWVKTNFDSRREKRQAEIQGLNEAKGLLSAA